jgi:hypothetical protein
MTPNRLVALRDLLSWLIVLFQANQEKEGVGC